MLLNPVCGWSEVSTFFGKFLYPNDKKMQKIFKQVELNPKWIDILNNHANKRNIKFFSQHLIKKI